MNPMFCLSLDHIAKANFAETNFAETNIAEVPVVWL